MKEDSTTGRRISITAAIELIHPLLPVCWLWVRRGQNLLRQIQLRFSKRERSHQVGRIDLDEFLLEQVHALGHPILTRAEGDDELKLALESVPADYALVLRLRFFDEMPLKRIGAFLGAPLSTVKWRIHRGKQLLREQIELLRQRGEKWKDIEK